jgi:nodulation protein E
VTRRVFITGMGCLSGLAQGVEATWAALLEGRDAMRPFELRLGEAPHLSVTGEGVWMDPPDTSAFGARFKASALAHMDPVSAYAVLAAHEALEDAGLLDQPELIRRAGVIIGCGAGGLVTVEQFYARLFQTQARNAHPMTIPRQMTSAPAAQVSMMFGARGPSFAVSSACASSAHALAEAAEMIRSGRLDIVIAGGAEASFTLGAWLSWQALRVVTRSRCRPFSAGRDGMALGEGGAALVLESEEHARARGARVHAEFLGAGAASDAGHITQPDGGSIAAAIRAALGQAGIAEGQPALISSHGTATLLNDKAEAAALRACFGAALDRSLVIATKPAHGHLCGGGGAIEFVIGVRALKAGMAPPLLNYAGPDPDCDLPLPTGGARPVDYDVLVSNSFAFGGLNAVLVARAMPRPW